MQDRRTVRCGQRYRLSRQVVRPAIFFHISGQLYIAIRRQHSVPTAIIHDDRTCPPRSSFPCPGGAPLPLSEKPDGRDDRRYISGHAIAHYPYGPAPIGGMHRTVASFRFEPGREKSVTAPFPRGFGAIPNTRKTAGGQRCLCPPAEHSSRDRRKIYSFFVSASAFRRLQMRLTNFGPL